MSFRSPARRAGRVVPPYRVGAVSRTKQGTSSLYSIADPGVFELCEQVCGGLRRQVSELDAILQGA
jgi:hypothetical protein